MPEIKNGIGPDHIVREGDTVIKNGIGPDHIVESIECGGFQYPPDLTGVDGHVVVTDKEITWDMLPTTDADNGSLLMLQDHPLYKVYEFDANWDNQANNELSWLTDVLQFRDNQISSGHYAFYGIPAAELTALPDLDTSNLTDMGGMFGSSQAFNQPVNHFDTSNVTDMTGMFVSTKIFNQPLDNFDTSNVTNMNSVFYAALAFNQDISMWCVSQIPDKPQMFDYMSGFQNQDAKQPQWGQPC